MQAAGVGVGGGGSVTVHAGRSCLFRTVHTMDPL